MTTDPFGVRVTSTIIKRRRGSEKMGRTGRIREKEREKGRRGKYTCTVYEASEHIKTHQQFYNFRYYCIAGYFCGILILQFLCI